MRKLIVSNFQTLDGFYESEDKTFHRFFDHFLAEYGRNDAFDVYNRDLLRDADTLILSGKTSFLGNQEYWTGVPSDPDASSTRREFADRIAKIDKIVVSNTITPADLGPWESTTRIVRGPDFGPHTLARLDELVRERFGAGARYDCEYLERIPPERSGKYRFCISRVRNPFSRSPEAVAC